MIEQNIPVVNTRISENIAALKVLKRTLKNYAGAEEITDLTAEQVSDVVVKVNTEAATIVAAHLSLSDAFIATDPIEIEEG